MKKVTATTVMMLFFVMCMFCVSTTNIWGQEKGYPNKPINLVLGFAPGGGLQIAAQVWVDVMKKYLNKQPMVLTYKVGAAQLIAAEYVRNSKPDGYTLLFLGYMDLMTKIALEQKEIKYRLDDLDNVGAFTCYPLLVIVPTDSPYKTIEDLIADAKNAPGKVSYASTGAGGLHHLAPEYFAMKVGMKLNHVAFQGGNQQLPAILGKHVHMGTQGVGTALPYLKPGAGMRSLLVFDKVRHPSLPDVPCSAEKGIDMQLGIWMGIQAPKGIPKEAKDMLIDAFKKTSDDPQIKASALVQKVAYSVDYINPTQVDKRINAEYRELENVWKHIGAIK